MNRIGLLVALAIAVVAGLAFGLYPRLDLALAAPFYAPETFWDGVGPLARRIRRIASLLEVLVAASAAISIGLKLLLPRRPMVLPGRAAVLILATLALGPGLLANVILKDNWARPRPIDVTEFGGRMHFVPWWDWRGECSTNCSFVGGESSAAFWTLSAAAVAPPHWRAFAYGAALAFGSAIGLLRMAGGGHFASDVVIGGVLIFLLIWLVHGLLYRWRATRISDDAVERPIAAITLPVYSAAAWMMSRLRRN